MAATALLIRSGRRLLVTLMFLTLPEIGYNGWLCERLRMGTPASVSQFVRRFSLSGGGRDQKIQSRSVTP
jgi:hypothetical protein